MKSVANVCCILDWNRPRTGHCKPPYQISSKSNEKHRSWQSSLLVNLIGRAGRLINGCSHLQMTSVPNFNQIGWTLTKLAHCEIFSKNRDLAGWAGLHEWILDSKHIDMKSIHAKNQLDSSPFWGISGMGGFDQSVQQCSTTVELKNPVSNKKEFRRGQKQKSTTCGHRRLQSRCQKGRGGSRPKESSIRWSINNVWNPIYFLWIPEILYWPPHMVESRIIWK